MTCRVSTRPEIPEKIKYPKSSSKVGFGEIPEIGRKVGPEVGFPLSLDKETYFRTCFSTYFGNFPETYF